MRPSRSPDASRTIRTMITPGIEGAATGRSGRPARRTISRSSAVSPGGGKSHRLTSTASPASVAGAIPDGGTPAPNPSSPLSFARPTILARRKWPIAVRFRQWKGNRYKMVHPRRPRSRFSPFKDPSACFTASARDPSSPFPWPSRSPRRPAAPWRSRCRTSPSPP